jgi:hypothetical protein
VTLRMKRNSAEFAFHYKDGLDLYHRVRVLLLIVVLILLILSALLDR